MFEIEKEENPRSKIQTTQRAIEANQKTQDFSTDAHKKEAKRVQHLVSSLREKTKSTSLSKKRKTVVESVEVHMIKLEDLPEPLSMREFREICLREGLPLHTGTNDDYPTGLEHEKTMAQRQKELQQKRIQQKWNNTVSNLFGAYLSVYDLFKKWHSGIIQQRHFGPESVEEHIQSQMPRPPFMNPIKPNLTEKEQMHVRRQKKLVNLLIQYGIGVGIQSDNQRTDSAANGKRMFLSPNRSHKYNYGPTIDQKMVSEQLNWQMKPSTTTSNQNPLGAQYLNLPINQNAVLVNDVKKRRFSFSVSEQSQNTFKRSNSERSNSVHVKMDIEVINNDDYEFFENQDDIQVAKNAVERLRIITATPESLMQSKAATTRRHHRPDGGRYFEHTYEEQAGGITEKELNNDIEFVSPQNKRLRKAYIEIKAQLEETKKKLELAENRNIQIVSGYRKEEMARSVQSKILSLPYPEQAEAIRTQIESKFYNVADGLQPELQEILNQKLNQIKEFFMGQIRLIQHHTDEFREKVDLMERVNKEGIKFADMDTEKLIERIGELEDLKRDQNAKLRMIDPTSRTKANMNRPQQVWNMLEKHFGSDYFLEVIEEEYGIAPGANEFFAKQIQDHFDSQILAYKIQQKNLEDELTQNIQDLQMIIQDLTERNTSLRLSDELRFEKMVQEHRANTNQLVKHNEELLVKNYKAKLQHAQETIQELVNQRDNQYRSQKSMQANYAWKRYQMFTTMRRIIANVNETKRTGIDLKVQKLCEKFITEEFLILRYAQDNDVPPMLVKDQMHRDKIYDMKKKLEFMDSQWAFQSNRANEYKSQLEDFRVELENTKLKNVAQMLEIRSLLAQNKVYEDVIKLKEKENKQLHDDLKTIENRWKNNSKEAHKFTAKPILQALELKSFNEMGSYMIREGHAFKRAIKMPNKTVHTTTELKGIRTRIEEIREVERQNIHNAECQTDNAVHHAEVQATQETKEVATGKDRDIRLITKQTQTEATYMLQQPQTLTKPSLSSEIVPVTGSAGEKQKALRASFVYNKPRMQKASSTILPKEFQFNKHESRIVPNQSQHSKDKQDVDQRSSLHDSAANLPLQRRNTFHYKKTNPNQISQNQDLEKTNSQLRKTLGGKVTSDDWQELSDDKSSYNKIEKIYTVDSLGFSDKNLLKSSSQLALNIESKQFLKQKVTRQTIAGSTASKHSSNNLSDIRTAKFQMKQSQQSNTKEVDMNLPDTSKKQHSSPLKGLQQSAVKGQETLDISSNQQAGVMPSKRKLTAQKQSAFLQNKQKDVNNRLTSAKDSNSRGQSQQQDLRNTLGKPKSKRDILANTSNLLSIRSTAPMKMEKKKSNERKNKVFSERKEKEKDEGTRSTQNKEGLAHQEKRNRTASSLAQSVGMTQKRAMFQKGLLRQDGSQPAPSGLSPDSQVNAEEGDEDLQLNFDRTQGQRFPQVYLNSFQEHANVSSPLNINTEQRLADYTTVQHLRERKSASTDSLTKVKNDNSIGAYNFIQPENSTSQTALDPHRNIENLENQALDKSQQRRPTTVRDTSKEQSNSSKAHENKDLSQFGHLAKYGVPDKSTSHGEDIYSIETKLSHISNVPGGNHKKTQSGLAFDLGKELLVNKSPESVAASKRPALFFGSNGNRVDDPTRSSMAGYAETKRLTLVREQDGEHIPMRESDSRLSELVRKKVSTRSLSNRSSSNKLVSDKSLVEFNNKGTEHTYMVPQNSNERYLILNRPIKRGHNGGKSSDQRSRIKSIDSGGNHQIQAIDDRVQLEILAKQKSFATDDDTSDYSRRDHQKNEDDLQQNKLTTQMRNIIKQESKNERFEDHQILSKQSRIQKLLLDGLINEEQFICLQLLEKGYTPSGPIASQRQNGVYSNDHSQRQSRGISRASQRNDTKQFRHENQPEQMATYTSGFYARSHRPGMSSSASHSPNAQRSRSQRRVRKEFIKNTYKIYPNKMPVLEKIFDRVYAVKKSKATQYSPGTAAEQEFQKERINWLNSMHDTRVPGQRDTLNQPIHHLRQRHLKKKVNIIANVKPKNFLTSKRQSAKDSNRNFHSTQQFATIQQLGPTPSSLAYTQLEAKGQHLLPSINTNNGNFQKSAEFLTERESISKMWVNAIDTHEPIVHKKATNKLKVLKQAQHTQRLLNTVDVKPRDSNINRPTAVTNLTERGRKPIYSPPDMITGFSKQQNNNLIVPSSHSGLTPYTTTGRQTAQSMNQMTSNYQAGTSSTKVTALENLSKSKQPILAQNASQQLFGTKK